MTSEALLKAIGAADDAVLLRCERPARRPYVYIAVAACAALAITIGLLAPHLAPVPPSLPAENSGTAATTVATTTSAATTGTTVTEPTTVPTTTTTSTKQPTKTSSVQIPLNAVCLTDGITPSEWISVPDTDREMATLLSEFSVSLLKNAYSGSGNHVTAPLTLYTALSMLYNGADGTTADQMRQVMGASPTFINERLGSLLRDMRTDTENSLLQTANSLWQIRHSFSQKYLQTVVDAYDADVYAGKFSPGQINEWVSENTHGRIPKILSDDSDADMYLITAQVLMSRWKSSGQKTDLLFNQADGSQVATTGILLDKACYAYAYISEAHTTVVCPLEKAHMLIIMPHEGNLSDLIQGLQHEDLMNPSSRGGTRYSTTEIILPEFSVSCSSSLKTALSNMGMPEIFNQPKADFRKMGYEIGQLWVDEILTETTFSVSEKGIDAAAAAAVYLRVLGGETPYRITIDHPFFYAVIDQKSQVPLYVGVQETVR